MPVSPRAGFGVVAALPRTPRGRWRVGLTLLVVVAAFFCGAERAEAGLADRVGSTFVLMLSEFVQTFQPVDGILLSVEGDRVYVDLSEKDKIQVGQELIVFRKGEVFRHPLTSKPLGNYENVLGYAQIRRVDARFSEALFIGIPDQPGPEPEDGVRISRGRIRVAVTPLLDLTSSGADFRRVPFLISSALDRSKRFQAADPLSVVDLFAGSLKVEALLARPSTAVASGRSIDVAWWIVPILLERGGTMYLDVTWISGLTGTALFSRREVLARPEAAEEQRFLWEPAVED